MKALHNAIIAYILIVNACKVCNAIISATLVTLSPCHNQNCAYIGVLRAVYIQPCIDIPLKPSRASMGFCDALTGTKKALANCQEMPFKLALSPIECQYTPYRLVDYRINGSGKNPDVCVIFENFRRIV